MYLQKYFYSLLQDSRKKFLTVRLVRHWEQVIHRSCGCPKPGSVQDQIGWGPEHPGLVEDVPAHSQGIGSRQSFRSIPI